MFTFSQTFEASAQFARDAQKKSFEALNGLRDAQLKLAQTLTQTVSAWQARAPDAVAPELAKIIDDTEMRIGAYDSFVRDALKFTQAASEKALAKSLLAGKNAVCRLDKLTSAK